MKWPAWLSDNRACPAPAESPRGLCPLPASSLGSPTCVTRPDPPGLIAPARTPDQHPAAPAWPPPQGCTLVVPLPEMLFHAPRGWLLRLPPQSASLK